MLLRTQQPVHLAGITKEGTCRSPLGLLIGLLLFPLLMILSGCQIPAGEAAYVHRPEFHATADSGGARLSLFLNLKNPATRGIRMEVSRIDILTDTTWVPVSVEPVVVDAPTLGGGQLFLGRCVLPPGRYQRLRFTIAKASMLKSNGDQIFLALDNPSVEMNLSGTLDLEQGDSESLFISWDEEESMRSPPLFQPSLGVAPHLKQMVADLAYVACPAIDTIYVIRTDKNWVCDSMGIPGGPTYISVQTTSSRNRLYVLTPGDASIKVVELPSNNIIDTITIPMTPTPSFMTLSPDGESAYVLDADGGYLLRINLNTGTMETRNKLGYKPEYAAYLNGHNLLAVTSTLSQSVLLVDPTTLNQVSIISTGRTPQGVAALGSLLYVAEGDTNSVTIYDLNNQAVRSQLTVGFAPYRITAYNNQLYVGNHDSNSISVLKPDQLSIAQEILLSGPPLEMAAEQNRKWLYVGNEKIDGLTVIDASINRVADRIIFGATPKGIAVVE